MSIGWTQICTFLFFFLLVPFFFGALQAFKRVLDIQRRDFYESWEADGKITSAFGQSSQISSLLVWAKWLVSKPGWAKASTEAIGALFKFRLFAFSWYFGILVWTLLLSRYWGS